MSNSFHKHKHQSNTPENATKFIIKQHDVKKSEAKKKKTKKRIIRSELNLSYKEITFTYGLSPGVNYPADDSSVGAMNSTCKSEHSDTGCCHTDDS